MRIYYYIREVCVASILLDYDMLSVYHGVATICHHLQRYFYSA